MEFHFFHDKFATTEQKSVARETILEQLHIFNDGDPLEAEGEAEHEEES